MDYCSFSDIPIEFLPPVPVPVMQTCPNGQQFLRKGQDRKDAPTLLLYVAQVCEDATQN